MRLKFEIRIKSLEINIQVYEFSIQFMTKESRTETGKKESLFIKYGEMKKNAK